MRGTTKDIETLRHLILARVGPYGASVFLFGSYARGEASSISDVDIAILPTRPLPEGLVSDLREAIEESDILLDVDLVDLGAADEQLRQRVLAEGVLWTA